MILTVIILDEKLSQRLENFDIFLLIDDLFLENTYI